MRKRFTSPKSQSWSLDQRTRRVILPWRSIRAAVSPGVCAPFTPQNLRTMGGKKYWHDEPYEGRWKGNRGQGSRRWNRRVQGHREPGIRVNPSNFNIYKGLRGYVLTNEYLIQLLIPARYQSDIEKHAWLRNNCWISTHQLSQSEVRRLANFLIGCSSFGWCNNHRRWWPANVQKMSSNILQFVTHV